MQSPSRRQPGPSGGQLSLDPCCCLSTEVSAACLASLTVSSPLAVSHVQLKGNWALSLLCSPVLAPASPRVQDKVLNVATRSRRIWTSPPLFSIHPVLSVLSCARHNPASGPLHLPSPLPGPLIVQISTWLAPHHLSFIIQ